VCLACAGCEYKCRQPAPQRPLTINHSSTTLYHHFQLAPPFLLAARCSWPRKAPFSAHQTSCNPRDLHPDVPWAYSQAGISTSQSSCHNISATAQRTWEINKDAFGTGTQRGLKTSTEGMGSVGPLRAFGRRGA
jgi:hypothetical protein